MNGLVLCLVIVVAVAAVNADGPKVTEKVSAIGANIYSIIVVD